MDKRRSQRRPAPGLVALLLVAGLLMGRPQPASAADAVVGGGSPGSCTEAAFDTALAAAQAGGGTLTFSCGSSPHTIVLTTQKFISASLELRGADLITLSGGNATSLFQVFSDASLTLSDITLTRGYGIYGAIENFGTLIVQGSRLENNTATANGGAILNHGSLTLTNSSLSDNTASRLGGGILVESGEGTVVGSAFTNNRTSVDTADIDGGGGGGIAANSGASLTVSDSTFSGNTTKATFAYGGGIRSAGTLSVTNTLFTGNSASRGGGLAVLGGTTSVSGSAFEGNVAAYGGGIRQSAGTLTVAATSFTGNGYSSDGDPVTTGGGALSWENGTADLNGVTISGNWASYGGGIGLAQGAIRLTNVTISGNEAGIGGGGIEQSGGSLMLTNVTVSNNAAPSLAGGISSENSLISLYNTLVAGNVNADTGDSFNCNKTLAPSSFSLSSDASCGFGPGRDNVDPLLGPLAPNGGAVQTQLLRRGSPAIDTGSGAACPATDARGITRPQGQACDIGAVEVTAAEQRYRVFLPALRH
jgi:hypothetical protein